MTRPRPAFTLEAARRQDIDVSRATIMQSRQQSNRLEGGACPRWSQVQHGPSGDEVIRTGLAACLCLKKKGPRDPQGFRTSRPDNEDTG